MALVLASTSPHRRALLEAAGIDFRAEAPLVKEVAPEGLAPRQIARLFSSQKADAVAERFPEDLVIGSDQTVDLDGELLRKPRNRADAARQLSRLAGGTHALHTGLALRRRFPALSSTVVETVRITLHPLTRREQQAYLDTEEWQGCAGGYRIEARGLKLVKALRGDYHAVIGLPMVRLVSLLRVAGVELF